ncbi:NYN domain-containing protein [Corynebacterium jeikeium]|uniref:NYN domain-containing protein n=1 Tax=Corynebacterium jeikeium TaxID=38289 RepID=UPI00088F7EC7|nr:NYN domain-containing protein [Corynebacterium jeikeium]SCX00016.1 NYN domain protein [Corynebacterium jeikeium]
MLERTQVYVDTSYLLASFYNSWDTGARAQLEIDLPEVVAVLGQMIQDQLKQPVHRQFWYDGIPDSGPHRYQRSLRSEPGVQLRAGQLIEWGDRRTQKAVDTRLVADIVIAAMKRQVSDIVLVSGDADMLPGVEEAVAAGIRVHLYGFGWDSMSSALRFACDTTTILDPREDFRDTMRLQVLEGPLPAGEQPEQPEDKPLGDAEEPTDSSPCVLTSANAPTDAPTDACENDTGEDCAPSDAAKPKAPSTPQIPEPVRSGPAATSRGATHPSVNQQATPTPATQSATETTTEPATGAAAAAQNTQPAAAEVNASAEAAAGPETAASPNKTAEAKPRPNPGMMARHRKLRSRYVPLPNEVWATAGEQSPSDIGQQYAVWWYDNVANEEQRDNAHLLSGGGLPPEIDRPLLQFACETLHEYTLSETQRVGLRDGFHSGIRAIMLR